MPLRWTSGTRAPATRDTRSAPAHTCRSDSPAWLPWAASSGATLRGWPRGDADSDAAAQGRSTSGRRHATDGGCGDGSTVADCDAERESRPSRHLPRQVRLYLCLRLEAVEELGDGLAGLLTLEAGFDFFPSLDF